MKLSRIFLTGLIIGISIAGIVVFIWLNGRFKDQARKDQLQIARQAEMIENLTKNGYEPLVANVLDLIDDELKDNPDSILVDMIKFNKMEPKLINKAAEQNDKFAIEFLRKRGAMLGSVIASVMNLLDIHLTIIGGGTSESNILISSTNEEMNSRLLKSIQPTSELRLAKYLKDSGVIGAANLFKILS